VKKISNREVTLGRRLTVPKANLAKTGLTGGPQHQMLSGKIRGAIIALVISIGAGECYDINEGGSKTGIGQQKINSNECDTQERATGGYPMG